MQIRVVSFSSPWVKDRLKNISLWWNIDLDVDYYDSPSPVEMREWGEWLSCMDVPMIERWKDPNKTITVLVAPYALPLNFAGFRLINHPSVRGLCDMNTKTLQVFANEAEFSYINLVNQGHTFELYLNHELSHYFYLSLGLVDRTHEYFYGGTPEKAREEIEAKLPKPIPPREQVLQIARDLLGKEASPLDHAPDEKACVESVCNILRGVFLDIPDLLYTPDLLKFLKNDPRFKATLEAEPGALIISPSGVAVGHVGIFSTTNKIMSNDSYTGLWQENYDIQNWVTSFRHNKGLSVFYFKIV